MIIFVLVLTMTYLLRETVGLDISWLAILPATLYLLVQHKPRWTTLFFIGYGCFLLFNRQALLVSFRLVLNEGITALAKWDWMLPLQQVHHNDATIGVSLLFVGLVYLLSVQTVWALAIGAILLPLVTKQPFHFLSFSLFFISCLLTVHYLKHQSFSILQAGLVVIICCLAFPLQMIPSLHQLGYQLEQGKEHLQYGASADTQLTNGHLQQLNAFEHTATPAFRLAMEHPRAMYLKSYVGAKYENGWTSINDQLLQEQTLLNHLEQAHHFTNTQFAQATKLEQTETVSIEMLNMSKEHALVPYELASAIDGFDALTSIWQSTKLLGTANYTFQIASQGYYDYPSVASALYETQDTPYLKLEALHNHMSYRYYTDIPQNTRTLLQNHFEEVTHNTYEQTIADVQAKVESIAYNENPAISKQDFVQFLLEDSKEGYAVHYATLATLLFRYYGVPARYVEGYIVSNEDVANAKKELIITSDARHAWPEIYIDWIGWIPVEVTPGYAEKMPSLASTTFEENHSTSAQNIGAATSAISQVANQPFADETTTTIQEHSTIPYWWLLLLLPIPFILWWKKQQQLNVLQRQFLKFIAFSRKKGKHTLPVHTIIYQLNTQEALAAYHLYNTTMYQQQPIPIQQKQEMKRLIKVMKKQLIK